MVQYISSSFWRRKINEKNFSFLLRYQFYTINALLSFLTSKTLLLFFLPNSYFWTFNFQFFYWYFVSNNYNVLLLFFNGRWICGFSLCPRVSVFSKTLAVFTLINQLMQMLLSRDVLPNECSHNVQKVVEKLYLWANSFLTEM